MRTPEEEEAERPQMLSRIHWPEDWRATEDYEREDEDYAVSFRCSWRTMAHPAGDLIETGEELCGSWHQQSNGGKRVWFACSGEFEAR